ncbi:carbohydrate-binding protein [Agaribacterium haliotis]|uniref:carbohydrate-binding protein n=1 Tax=Agaribacterium haliotis TaxID=2013869 RepID=UPI00130407D9|nr:carbohydrate-binding protein [Agaribacterium haliotis]
MKRSSLFSVLFFTGFSLFFSALTHAAVYEDHSAYTLVDANNGGQVRLRDAPAGSGSVAQLRAWLQSAELPASVHNSRLTEGEFASNIAQMDAVKNTLSWLANDRPATYSGAATIVNNSNLEQHRAAIAAAGGTFVFRGTVDVTSREKLIQVGENTTVWIDGTVRYTGPVIPGTIPDEYSVSDVINGIFEVRGSNTKAKANVKILGTKRGKLLGNDRLAAVYTRYAKALKVEGLNTDNCRNVLFLNNVYGDSLVRGNFIYNSTRRAIHVKASNGIRVENNLIFDADVDGIDIDAYTKNSITRANVLVDSGSRWMVWTEIASVDNLIDANVGIHVRDGDGGFQENGSESNGQPATARNTWQNNHIFYADSSSNWKQGFSFHPGRVIDRASVIFDNNFVWQRTNNAYKRNPKADRSDDVSYYLYVGAAPTPAPSALPSPSPSIPSEEQHAYKSMTIPGLLELEDFDVGGEGVAYHDSDQGNSGRAYRPDEHIDIQTTTDSGGGFNLGWLADGEWLEYSLADVAPGNYDIELRVAAKDSAGAKAVKLILASRSLAVMEFDGTGGWQNWKTVTLKNVNINAHSSAQLRLEVIGGNFNLNWLRFKRADSTAVEFVVQAENFVQTGGSYGGFQRYTTADGVDAINFNQRGDWADYQLQVPVAGNYRMQAWLATTQSGGAIELLLNGVSYIFESVPNNGNWDKFIQLNPNALIPLEAGQQSIRIRSAGNSSSTWEWNADRFVFIKQ